MTNLTDMLTAVQNIPTAINKLATTYLNVQGLQTLADISAATIVKNSSGRVATITVTTVGTSTGKVYDQSALTPLVRAIFVIPEAVGIYVVNMPTSYGILVVPGTGQSVAVSYS